MVLELPANVEIKSILPHGASYWTRTAEIVTRNEDGSEVSYFLKVCMFYGNYVGLI